LGFETAIKLEVLKMGENISQIQECEEMSKIKGVTISLPIDRQVTPVVQPYRRIPIALEDAVEKKIEELLRLGIIEKVKGASRWVSPMVVIPKDADIRICVDMRCANKAVKRENYPLPTIEDFLPHLGKGKVFTKLDVKNAFHQVEISEESREITTFITKKGLYRYKRLMFGIVCAP